MTSIMKHRLISTLTYVSSNIDQAKFRYSFVMMPPAENNGLQIVFKAKLGQEATSLINVFGGLGKTAQFGISLYLFFPVHVVEKNKMLVCFF